MARAGSLKLDFMAKSIGIHFFEFEDMFRCYRDNENLKKHFGHIDTLIMNIIIRRRRRRKKKKEEDEELSIYIIIAFSY